MLTRSNRRVESSQSTSSIRTMLCRFRGRSIVRQIKSRLGVDDDVLPQYVAVMFANPIREIIHVVHVRVHMLPARAAGVHRSAHVTGTRAARIGNVANLGVARVR